jgi:hypothetical protein
LHFFNVALQLSMRSPQELRDSSGSRGAFAEYSTAIDIADAKIKLTDATVHRGGAALSSGMTATVTAAERAAVSHTSTIAAITIGRGAPLLHPGADFIAL